MEIFKKYVSVILSFIRNIYLVFQMTKMYFSYVFGFPPQFLALSSQHLEIS